MILVLFEVYIKEEYWNSYLEIAASLREDYMKNEGFISSERFSSINEEGKLLSLSKWRDEESLEVWRNNLKHRGAQRMGRDKYFESYRITVVSPIRSYTLEERAEAPQDSNDYFDLK